MYFISDMNNLFILLLILLHIFEITDNKLLIKINSKSKC